MSTQISTHLHVSTHVDAQVTLVYRQVAAVQPMAAVKNEVRGPVNAEPAVMDCANSRPAVTSGQRDEIPKVLNTEDIVAARMA